MSIPGYVVPGQIVCPVVKKDAQSRVTTRYQPGRGTMISNVGGVRAITATTVGKVDLKEVTADKGSEQTSTKDQQACYVVQVLGKLGRGGDENEGATSVLPDVGDIVLARVTRLMPKQAHVEILVVENRGPILADGGLGVHGAGKGVTGTLSGNQASSTSTVGEVGEGFGGIIRVQDVRATERDKVKILTSFKPGDIVRASVISLGDGTNYYLTTASNELGVIFARSASGHLMYPVDWQSMQCFVTGVVEPRKVAKPF